MSWEEEEVALAKECEQLALDYQKAQQAFEAYRERVGAHVDKRLRCLSDMEILANPELRRWLVKAAWDHAGARRRLKQLTDYDPLMFTAEDDIDWSPEF